jgi:transcriptional regulator with XRE-family HTH domain
LKDDFGTLLQRHREAKGFTQKDFADALGISVQRCNRYEKQGMTPNIELLINMARTLHITVDNLIGYDPYYDELDTARQVLDDVELDSCLYDPWDKEKEKYRIGHSDEWELVRSPLALIRYTFAAQHQTNDMLCESLDSIFITAFKYAFWWAYDRKLYNKDVVNRLLVHEKEKTTCDLKEFSERLAYFRGELGLSQTDFADKLGISHVQTYNRYEKKGAQPSIPLLANMAYELGISVHTLTGADNLTLSERLLYLLNSVGLECWSKRKKYYLNNTRRIKTHWPEIESDTEIIELTEEELGYYVSMAWQMIIEVRFSLDELYKKTFRNTFYYLNKSYDYEPPPNIKIDYRCCLYKKTWYDDMDNASVPYMHT